MKKNLFLIIFYIILIFLMYKEYKRVNANYYNEVKFWQYNQAIIVYDKQYEELKKMWFSKDLIINLLTLKAMECNSYKGDCIWLYGPDIWHYQINSIHKKEYKKSYELYNKKQWWELFVYQSKFAKWLVESYLKNNCSEKSFKKAKKLYNEDEKFKCIARNYNWSSKKISYSNLALIKKNFITWYLENYDKKHFSSWSKFTNKWKVNLLSQHKKSRFTKNSNK